MNQLSNYNLKEIFDSITPENIKNIPLMRNAMDIFINKLEEHSAIAIDIKKMWDNIPEKSVVGGRTPDSELTANAKNRLREIIIDTYVVILKQVVTNAQNNKQLYAKFDRDGITDTPLSFDVVDIINNEYIVSNKLFNEKVGTETGIRYAYNFAQYLQGREYNDDMVLTDVQPFLFNIQGSIYHEMYEEVVKPLAHPLGFCYSYEQVIYEFITDYYGIKTVYDFRSIEIRQIDGYFDVFTQDSTDDNVRAKFLTERINPLTNEIFTLGEYQKQVKVYTSKYVEDYYNLLSTEKYRMVLFSDGTCIINYSDGRVIYCLYSEWLKNNNNPVAIKAYSEHASLYLEYTTDFEFEYYDKFLMRHESTLSDSYDIFGNGAEHIDDSNFDTFTHAGSGMYLYTSDGKYLYTADEYNETSNDVQGFYLYGYDNL